MAGPIRISILANGAQARREMTRTAGTMGKAFKGTVAAVGLTALTAKAVGFAKSAVDLEAKFSRTMNTIAAATGAPAAEMGKLNDLAIKLGKDTAFSAGEAADAMLELAKAGIDTKTIMGGGLSGTLTLAAAGGTELGTAATIASNALNSFNLKGRDMASVAAALAGGANASSASVESLGQGLSQVGAGAVNAGLSLQETVAALSAFDAAGIKGSDAGTSLKTMLARLIPASEKAENAMEALGLQTDAGNSVFVKANGEFESLRTIAGELQKRLGGLSAAQRTTALNTIFGSDASRAATVLMKEGATGIRGFVKATNDQGAAQKMAAARMKGTAGALERLSGSVETAKLRLGQELAPVVQKTANYLGDNLVPAIEAGIEGGKQLADALAPAVTAIASALGNLLPSAKGTSSVFKDDFIPAVRTASEIVAGIVGFLDDLPDPLKQVGVQAGIAALVFPRLAAGVTGATTAIGFNIARLQQLRAEMTYTATRAQVVSTAMARLSGAAKTAAGIGGMVALTQASGSTNKALGVLGNTAGGALLGFSVGGPIGAAIGGGAGALLGLYQATKKSSTGFATGRQSAIDFASSLDQITGASTEATRALALSKLQNEGAITSARQLGISSRTLVSATLGNKAALDAVTAAGERYSRGARDILYIDQFGAPVYRQRSELWERNRQAADNLRAALGGLTPQLRKQAREVRANAAASQKLTALFPQLRKGAIVKIRALGADPSRKAVLALAKQLKLTPREKRVLLRVAGVRESVDGSRRVNKSLTQTGRAKADFAPWLRSLGFGLQRGNQSAVKGGRTVERSLEAGPRGAKADLSGLIGSIRSGTNSAAGVAGAGGRSIGDAMQAGVVAGFSGTASQLSAMAYSAVSSAIGNARKAGDIHSPSRKMRRIGEQLGDGLVEGMSARERHSREAGRRMVASALAGATVPSRYQPGAKALAAYAGSGGRGGVVAERVVERLPPHVTLVIGDHEFKALVGGVSRSEIDADRRFQRKVRPRGGSGNG